MLSVACDARPQELEADLRAAAARALPRLEELAGLEQRYPVALGVRTRPELRRFIERRLAEDLPEDEVEGVRATYVALDLVPPELDLETLLLDLYTEQIVGFYDPGSDTLYVVDDVPADQRETVLVHELVHALQDQHADLEALMHRSLGSDRQRASQAAIEGHATLVMVAYALDALGADPGALIAVPDLAAQLGPALQASSFPVLADAPRIIRDGLLFPYFSGAGFVQELWRARAAGVLARGPTYPAPLGDLLPASTEQVRRPEARFLADVDAPTGVSFGPPESDGWPTLYENTLGELELAILLGEWLGEEAEALAYGWDGDRYLTLRDPAGGVALDIAIVWDDAASADAFAEAYRRASAARTHRSARVVRGRLAGMELVRIADVPAGTDPETMPARPLVLRPR